MRKFVMGLLILSLAFIQGCGASNEASKAVSESKPAASVPATPSGISTISEDGRVTLRWATSGGASAYNIYFSDMPNIPRDKATKIGDVTGTSFVHKGIANNTAYYYRISAINFNGESPPSVEMAAMPRSAPPAAPAGVAATGGDGKITVKWTSVKGAAAYNIYFSTRPQMEKSKRMKIGNVNAPPFEHKNIKKKTMYFYQISAVNAGGEGPLSTESGAMP